jgi:hypothetical protein
MKDHADIQRRKLAASINANPKTRDELEAEHGPGNVWSTKELARDFIVIGFAAPVVAVRRKIDGQRGSLFFQHEPRLYYAFQPE